MSMSTPINTAPPKSTCPLPPLTTDDLLDFKHMNGPAMTKNMIAVEHRNKWTNLNTGNLYKMDYSQKVSNA